MQHIDARVGTLWVMRNEEIATLLGNGHMDGGLHCSVADVPQSWSTLCLGSRVFGGFWASSAVHVSGD
jgi:hypothetical protein